MANCDRFIAVCGGNSILSSYFGGTVISYVHKGKELRQNYFGENSYFRKLSNANIIPVYDVIGLVNKETYEHEVNQTGTNDYTKLLNTIKENF
jgi:anthranilate/para-aminobenzoate synthase component II